MSTMHTITMSQSDLSKAWVALTVMAMRPGNAEYRETADRLNAEVLRSINRQVLAEMDAHE